jgi:hypothetical protein
MRKYKGSHEQDIQNHMKRIVNSKSPIVFLLAAVIGASFFLSNNHNVAIAQTFSVPNTQSYSVGNIGNVTNEESDTFFQLDDAVQATQTLINETQSAISNNNITEAMNLLNQAYNETVQIQNNANNLIWDSPSSNEGA